MDSVSGTPFKSLMFTLLLACSSIVSAASPGVIPPEENPWSFHATLYGWIFGMNGTMTVMGTEADVDVTPIDVLRNLSKLDAIFELHVEARKGRWSFMVDPTYLKVTQDATVGPLSASITPELFLMDFGAFYTLAESALSNPANHNWAFQLFGGGRFFNIKSTIHPSDLPSVSGEENFITPIIGARFITYITENIDLILRGDVGGFGVDDVDLTWSASMISDIHFKKHFTFTMGFRLLDIDFARGSGANRFAVDTLFYGPIIGLGVNL